jgi:SAM-dependent methyltransferase
MDKPYFKRYYKHERTHWWFKVRWKIIEDQLVHLKGSTDKIKILNIGVATGYTTEMLEKHGEVTSIEFDKDCCEFLKEELNIEVINGSILDLPFEDSSFDYVFALDVIEHVENDRKAMDEMLRVSRSDGHVFITVPAYMFLWSEHDDVNHHFRRYTSGQIKSLFVNREGTIRKLSYFNTLLFPPIYALRKIKTLFYRKDESKTSNSDFETLNNSLFGTIAGFIFNLERPLLKILSLPFGVSIISIFKNEKKEINKIVNDKKEKEVNS